MEVELIQKIEKIAISEGVKPVTVCTWLGFKDGKTWNRLNSGCSVRAVTLRRIISTLNQWIDRGVKDDEKYRRRKKSRAD